MRILMLDDRAPHPWLGAGYPRAHMILTSLAAMGHKVGFLPCVQNENRKEAAKSLPGNCKYLPQTGEEAIVHYVAQHAHRYDVLWVSRPHNMALLQRYLPDDHPVWRDYSLVVYDAEAIFALRNREMKNLYPNVPKGRPLAAEIGLTDVADVVTAVSLLEEAQFQRRGKKTIRLTTAFDSSGQGRDFGDREGLLFVGALAHHPSPNSDALLWFCRHVAPILREEIGDEFHLNVAGILGSEIIRDLHCTDIQLLGVVPDLAGTYAHHRVFIAPHRFAAGVPNKVLEAASHGLPVVASDLLAQQLQWHDRVELVNGGDSSPAEFADACISIYRDASLWEEVRAHALAALQAGYSTSTFTSALQQVLAVKR